ncbi:MAG: hypothetical protein JNM66_03150 [Bryobacterales bacterium]|nr:hypothetical protein [Bryobacterales bacterium]
MVRKTWPLDVMGRNFIALRREDLAPDERPLDPKLAWSIFQRAFANPRDIRQLISISAAFWPVAVRAHANLRQSAFQKAVESGALVLLVRSQNLSAPKHLMDPVAAEAVKDAKEVTTWIEIELLDMADKPVPNGKYLCMMPDGAMREGTMDAKGRVRFDGIQPGNCVWTFTDLDAEAWERVV